LASDSTALALAHRLAGFGVEVEAACCATPGGPTGNDCPCDDAIATELAGLLGEVTAALRPHGKALSMDVNEHGSGYLTMPCYARHLAAGVGRLRQMGTYGLNNRTAVTQALLRGWAVGWIGFGMCTLDRYAQNTSTVRSWLRELSAAHHQQQQRDGGNESLEVDVYMLQAGVQRVDRTGATPGSAVSPPQDWWPLLRNFRSGKLQRPLKADDASAGAAQAPAVARFLRYGMLSMQFVVNYVARLSVPYLVPFLARDLGLSGLQASQLISAFAPGYVCTQIPASWCIERFGAKAVLTANNVAMALLLLAIPWAARQGMAAAWACFFGLGVSQGPFIVAQNVMTAEHVPSGPERPWALMIIRQGSNVAKLVASSLTPLLCGRLSWQRTAWVYGAAAGLYGCVWHAALPADRYKPLVKPSLPEPGAGAKTSGRRSLKPSLPGGSSFRLAIAAPTLACQASHIARDFIEFHTLGAYAPVFFHDVHRVALDKVGRYTTGAMAVQILGKVLIAAWESRRLARGTATLRIRRESDTLAALGGSAGLVLFGLAPSPELAAVAYAGIMASHCFDYAGFMPNYLEVGGPDTGRLGAITNTGTWVASFLLSNIVQWLKQTTGSWRFVLWFPAGLRLAAAINYRINSSVLTARQHVKILHAPKYSGVGV
jgi:hypothetical protein